MSDAIKQLEVIFKGHVHGVGFRYSVCSIARQFSVVGYVRNCMDGSVEVVAEGTQNELNDFVESICKSRLKEYIFSHTCSWAPASNKFHDFGVKY